MGENKSPWMPFLIIGASGFVLMVSSCFGLAHWTGSSVEAILSVTALAGALVFVVGVLCLLVLGVLALVSAVWGKRT